MGSVVDIVDAFGRHFNSEDQVWRANEFNFKSFDIKEAFYITLKDGKHAAAFIADFVKPQTEYVYDKKEECQKLQEVEAVGRLLVLAYSSVKYRFVRVEEDFSLSELSDIERRRYFFDLFGSSSALNEYNFVLHGRDYTGGRYGLGIAASIALFSFGGRFGLCSMNGGNVDFIAIGADGVEIKKTVPLCVEAMNENNVLEFDGSDFAAIRNENRLPPIVELKLKKILG